MSIGPNYQYKVIITFFVHLHCSEESIKQEIFKLTQSNTTNIQFIPLLICSNCEEGGWWNRYKQYRPNEYLTSFIEDSEIRIDEYYYLSSIEKSTESRSIRPLDTVMNAVIFSILFGCSGCFLKRKLFPLVEENFNARNNEREWLEKQDRRRERRRRRRAEYGVDVANEQVAENVDGVRENGGIEINSTQLSSEIGAIPYENIMTNGTQSSSETEPLIPNQQQV